MDELQSAGRMLEPTLMSARPISSDDNGKRPASRFGPSAPVRNKAVPPELPGLGPASQLSIPQAELCKRLRAGVERAAARNADSMEALRAAVCEFTAALKEKGTTPEGVLVSLKAVVNDQARALVSGHPSDSVAYTLNEQMSTWSIQEYFGEPAR